VLAGALLGSLTTLLDRDITAFPYWPIEISIWCSVFANIISKTFFTYPRQKKLWERIHDEMEERERLGLDPYLNGDEDDDISQQE